MEIPPIVPHQRAEQVSFIDLSISSASIKKTTLKRLQNVLRGLGKNIQEAQTPEHLNEQFHEAIKSGNLRLCKTLLSHTKLNPNVLNKEGNTPLTSAIFFGKSDVVELLLSHSKINPNQEDLGGMTPLNNAILHDQREIVELLLKDSRIDPNLRDKNGVAPIMKILDVVLEITEEDDEDFDWREYSNRLDMLSLLLAHPKIDPNPINRNGSNQLLALIRCLDTVKTEELFVAIANYITQMTQHQNFNPNIKSKTGNTLIADITHFSEKNIAEDTKIILLKIITKIIQHKDFNHEMKNRDGSLAILPLLMSNDPEIIKLTESIQLNPETTKSCYEQIQQIIIDKAVRGHKIHPHLIRIIEAHSNSEFIKLIELHNKGFTDLFKLFLSRHIKLTGEQPLNLPLHNFIEEIAKHKPLFKQLNFALSSNLSIPLTVENVLKLVEIDSNPYSDRDKLIVAIQGGASLGEIEKAGPFFEITPPKTLAEWKKLDPKEQLIALNHCIVFKSRTGLTFAEEILKDITKKLEEGPLSRVDHTFARHALRLIERIETTSHEQVKDMKKWTHFENHIAVLLFNGLTQLVNNNQATIHDLKLLKQTFITLSKVDQVHYKQRNLPALIQSLTALTEGKDHFEIERLAEPICGALEAMRNYYQFEKNFKRHPEWSQMLLALASSAEQVQSETIKHRLLFELGQNLSLIPDPNILKKAYQIVQGPAWDHLTVGEKKSLHREIGHYSLTTYRPTAHDYRENISRRILDTLTTTLHLEQMTDVEFQKFLESPHSYPDIEAYQKKIASTQMHNVRYMDPLYLPSSNAPLYRGINARKGSTLLNDALFDLLKRGAGAAELTNVTAKQGTWAKIGHIFSSLNSGYVMDDYFSDGGALMIIDPNWVNEQIRIRQVRNETEAGAFHYVFYQTVPLEGLNEIFLPKDIFDRVNGLYAAEEFTTEALEKSGVEFPATEAEQGDLFLLYQALKEHGETLIPKLKTYSSVKEVKKKIPKEADFQNDVVPENVRRFIGRKLAKEWLDADSPTRAKL